MLEKGSLFQTNGFILWGSFEIPTTHYCESLSEKGSAGRGPGAHSKETTAGCTRGASAVAAAAAQAEALEHCLICNIF